MTFDRNQEKFDDFMHRKIWGLGFGLVPIEKTLPYIEDNYRNTCTDLYHFMKSVFEDMFENIDLYGFNKDNVPEISREGTLLKKKPEYPFWFFIKLAEYSEIDEDGNLVLSTVKYNKVIKNFDVHLINLLNRHGLVINTIPSFTVISNTKFPNMFRIILHMNRSNNKYSIMTCDFRYFKKLKLEGFEIIIENLSDKQQKAAIEIDNLLCSKGFKREKRLSIGRLIYRFNKEIMIYLYSSDNRLQLGIIFEWNNGIPFELLCSRIDIYDNSDELKTFIINHLKPCTVCTDHSKCNFYLSYNDKTVKTCLQRPGVYFTDFDIQNMEYIRQLVDIKLSIAESTE